MTLNLPWKSVAILFSYTYSSKLKTLKKELHPAFIVDFGFFPILQSSLCKYIFPYKLFEICCYTNPNFVKAVKKMCVHRSLIVINVKWILKSIKWFEKIRAYSVPDRLCEGICK